MITHVEPAFHGQPTTAQARHQRVELPGELRLKPSDSLGGPVRAIGIDVERHVGRKPDRVFVDEVVQADPIRIPVPGEVARGHQGVAAGQLHLVPEDHIATVDRKLVEIGVAIRVEAASKCRVAKIAVDTLILDIAGKALATQTAAGLDAVYLIHIGLPLGQMLLLPAKQDPVVPWILLFHLP